MLSDEELAEARHKLAAGRIYATRLMPYFTTALMAMSPTERIGLGTFAVDERWRLYYDPLKCLEWSVKEITAAWLHEVGHLIRNHNARFKELEGYNHDHAIFNAACDAAINSDLREMSILLPNPELRYYAEPNPNFPKWKKGMTAEQMYFIGRGSSAGNSPEKDNDAGSAQDKQEDSQEKPDQSDPQNSPQDDSSRDGSESENELEDQSQDRSEESAESKEQDSEAKGPSAKNDSSDESSRSSENNDSTEDDENGDSDNPDNHPDDDSESAVAGDDDKSKSESDDEESSESKDGSQDNSPDEASDENGDGSSESENSDELGEGGDGGDKSSESSGTDDGDAEPEGDITLEDGEGSGDTYTEDGDTDGAGLSGSSGMPLPDCGSAVDGIQRDYEETNDNDGSIDKTSAESIKKDTARAILDYANSHPGTVPGSLVREAENILDPQVDWQDEFSALVRHIAASHSGYTNYSYQRPSRRSAGHSFIMPSMRNPPAPEIAIILDTSGSMDEKKELALGLAEMEEIINRSARNSVSQSIKIINCDSAAATVEVVRDLKDFEIIGGGGTDMRVGIKAAAEIKPKVDIIIVVTDGFTPWPIQIPEENPRAFYVALIVGRGEKRGDPKVPDWMKVITVNIPQKRKGYTIHR